MRLKYGTHTIVGKGHMVTIHYCGDTCHLELNNFGGVATLASDSINKSLDKAYDLMKQYLGKVKL
jgi:tartrate dehydratase beta subunit/fumarate hydratase class I family protein